MNIVAKNADLVHYYPVVLLVIPGVKNLGQFLKVLWEVGAIDASYVKLTEMSLL